ncbi:MAG: hypothetical protein WD136_02515 [Cyanobium sp.]
MPIDRHVDPKMVRTKINHDLTGRDGGRDINLRQRVLEGMVLHGRLVELGREGINFADDLAANLDQADSVYCRIRSSIDAYITQEELDAPIEPSYEPCWQPTPGHGLDLATEPLAAVIWCTGYPAHLGGVTQSSCLYFLG